MKITVTASSWEEAIFLRNKAIIETQKKRKHTPRVVLFFRDFWEDAIAGLREGYDLCCVLEFSLRAALGQVVAERVGCYKNPLCREEHVHCFLHRKSKHKNKGL